MACTFYAEVKAMKMYMTLTAQEAGCLTLLQSEGSLLELGDLFASCPLEDPKKVHRA